MRVYNEDERDTINQMRLNERKVRISLISRLIIVIKNLGGTVLNVLQLLNLKLESKMQWIVLKALSGVVKCGRTVTFIVRQKNWKRHSEE